MYAVSITLTRTKTLLLTFGNVFNLRKQCIQTYFIWFCLQMTGSQRMCLHVYNQVLSLLLLSCLHNFTFIFIVKTIAFKFDTSAIHCTWTITNFPHKLWLTTVKLVYCSNANVLFHSFIHPYLYLYKHRYVIKCLITECYIKNITMITIHIYCVILSERFKVKSNTVSFCITELNVSHLHKKKQFLFSL